MQIGHSCMGIARQKYDMAGGLVQYTTLSLHGGTITSLLPNLRQYARKMMASVMTMMMQVHSLHRYKVEAPNWSLLYLGP